MSQNAIQRARLQGFSLIELLVSMVIGLVVTLAITSVMIRSESSKRSTTSVNDINQSGSYAAFVLDREIRSAGSGFSQHWDQSYGCLLNAGKTLPAPAAQLLPMPTAIPATSAFQNMPQTYRVAPIVVSKGAADVGANRRGDVLVVMGGTAGFAEVGSLLTTVDPAGPTLTPPSTMPFDPPVAPAGTLKSVVLLADASVPAGCLLTEVNQSSAGQLKLGGGYYSGSTGITLNNFVGSSSTYAMQLGTEVDNRPNFHMYGVGPQNTLMSYDLLAGPAPDVPVADGVVEMRVLYGLDTTVPADGVLDSWIDPGTAPFDAATLTDGSSNSQKNLRQIIAVRVGFILRTSLEEQATSASDGGYTAPDNIYLFSDAVDKNGASLKITRPVPAAEKHYRYRTFEVTIPLRNVML